MTSTTGVADEECDSLPQSLNHRYPGRKSPIPL